LRPVLARPLLVAGAAFLLSGAAGLIYQVAWQRILALHSGVGIYSVAVIVAAFMAGLGVGSHLGGVLSLRLSARAAVRGFALVELGIGVFGALSCALYYDLLYLRGSWLYSDLWRAGLLHFLGLFLPTCLMGMSLPLLVRGTVREASGAGRVVGTLYGINLLGASLGALVTPWFLIRYQGIRGAVLTAAALNVAAGLLALAAGRSTEDAADEAPGPPAAPPAVSHPLPLWIGLYALSGFLALSLEVLWFRILELTVKATAFTFGTMLCYYLLGSAVGCFLAAPRVARLQHPLRVFLACQCVLLLYAGVAVVLLARLPPDMPVYDWFFRYWNENVGFKLGEIWDPGRLWRLYGLFPALLYGPPTVLMGFSFPVLQRAVHDDPRTSGRKVGILQAANIAGCVAGSLLIGLGALQLVGTTGSLRLLCGLGLLMAAAGLRWAARPALFAGFAAALVAVVAALPSQHDFWTRLHGSRSTATLVDEDASGVVAIVPNPRGPWRVFVSGKNNSQIPFGGMHTRLGAGPALVHPAPVDVAIIGLGSGDTAWSAGVRPETRSITVFEISGPQPRLLRRLAAGADVPALRAFLEDPRVRIVVADGRRALRFSDARYDVIEADALWPHVSGAGNLYSVEFFRECAARLKPGGIMCTWAPTPRIYASFSQVFPYVLGTASREVLIGSLSPLPDDTAVWEERLASPAVQAYLGAASAEPGRLLRRLIGLNRRGWRHTGLDTNHDLWPKDEFNAP
jgi:spermidine synthase